MQTENKEKRIQELLLTIVLAGLLLLLAILFKTGCPLDLVFGVPCPLCGTTRAFLSLLHGDISGAFYYHPLWPVTAAAMVMFILYRLEVIRLSEKAFTASCIILAALLLGCWIIRHIQGSPVVSIHFESSIAGRIYMFVITALK